MIHITNTPYAMPHRERLNNANEVKRMTDLLGHSDNLITLSGTNSQLYNIKFHGRPLDNIWIFLQTCKEV